MSHAEKFWFGDDVTFGSPREIDRLSVATQAITDGAGGQRVDDQLTAKGRGLRLSASDKALAAPSCKAEQPRGTADFYFGDDGTVRASRSITHGELVEMPIEAFEALWRRASQDQKTAFLRGVGTSDLPASS